MSLVVNLEDMTTPYFASNGLENDYIYCTSWLEMTRNNDNM